MIASFTQQQQKTPTKFPGFIYGLIPTTPLFALDNNSMLLVRE